jgi:hypothetical protein
MATAAAAAAGGATGLRAWLAARGFTWQSRDTSRRRLTLAHLFQLHETPANQRHYLLQP